MEKDIKKEFRDLIAHGEPERAIEKLLTDEAIKSKSFNEIVALKNQIRQLKRNRNEDTIKTEDYNMNYNRIISSLLKIVDEYEKSQTFNPEEYIAKFENEIKIKEFIYNLVSEDRIKDSINIIKAWLLKKESVNPDIEKELSLLSSQLNQIVNEVRLGIVDNNIYRVERSKLTQNLLKILGFVFEGDEKKIEKIRAEEKLERTAASFVQDSITELSKRESRLKLLANFWYIIGFIALILGVALGVYFSSIDNTAKTSILSITYVIVRNILTIALLIVASRYSFNLGKTYMNESLKNADRIHAISFGKFYLQVYGSDIKQEELREVFKDWNTNQESAFLKLDSKDIDPKILESILKLAESLKK